MKSRKYCEVWKEDTSSEMVMWQAPGATCDVCDGRCDAESDVGLHMTQLLTPPLHKYHILNIFDVIWAKIPHPPSYKTDKIRVYQQHITFLSQGFLENWEMHQNILDFWYSLIKFKMLLDQRTEHWSSMKHRFEILVSSIASWLITLTVFLSLQKCLKFNEWRVEKYCFPIIYQHILHCTLYKCV